MIVCVQYYHWTVIPSNVPTRPSTCTHGRKRLRVFVCLGCACLASPTQWGVMICESPSARNNPQWQCLYYNRLQMFAHSTVHTKTNNMALTKPYKRWGVYTVPTLYFKCCYVIAIVIHKGVPSCYQSTNGFLGSGSHSFDQIRARKHLTKDKTSSSP